ncbi:MAG: nucleotide kinase domain-containing protein [Terriglobia bacterium]
MVAPGRLYVFEGPDGVGKSELSARFTDMLKKMSAPAMLLSFPGKDAGTLGRLVYDLHHGPGGFGISKMSPASLQLMHIAAHVDTIKRVILPALRAGKTVVLDRFWWSTKVYGLADGSDRRVIDNMIRVELAAWGTVRPSSLFLIRRRTPLRVEPEARWVRWRDLYDRLAAEQKHRTKIVLIDNDGPIEATVRQLAVVLHSGNNEGTDAVNSQIPLELSGGGSLKGSAPVTFSSVAPAKPTIVYNTYWRFATERQEIFFKRWKGSPPPWTSDRILSQYKFTNTYRASDRVSQFLIKEVIYSGDQSEEEVFFRTILFKLFNKIETWQLLRNTFGAVTYKEFDLKLYDTVLSKASAAGEAIYSGAYIMPSGSSAFGTTRKHRAHLKLLKQLMDDEVALRIAGSKSMRDAFTLLRSYPMIGDFLAYQYVTDVNYSTLTDFSEMEFVIPGPGAKGGISKCFESLGGLTEADLIRVIADRQVAEFERLGIEFKSLWGRPLQLIDCQNLFCEVDKYARVHHPDITGKSARTRIKQKFRATPEAIDYWYPPKWGLNDKIAASKRELRHETSRVST